MVQLATRQYRDTSVTRPKLDNSVRNWPTTEIDHTDSPYTVLADDLLILVDTSTNQVHVDLTLIGSVPDGRWVVIKDAANNAGTYTITVDPNGSTIDGSAASLGLAGDSDSVTLVKGGSGWFVLAGDITSQEFDLPLTMPMGGGIEIWSTLLSPEEGAPYEDGILGTSSAEIWSSLFSPEEVGAVEDGIASNGKIVVGPFATATQGFTWQDGGGGVDTIALGIGGQRWDTTYGFPTPGNFAIVIGNAENPAFNNFYTGVSVFPTLEQLLSMGTTTAWTSTYADDNTATVTHQSVNTTISNRDTGQAGDTVDVDFTFTLPVPTGRSIIPGTVVIRAPGKLDVTDDGAGNLVSAELDGAGTNTITYSTGFVDDLQYLTAPGNGAIFADYILDSP